MAADDCLPVEPDRRRYEVRQTFRNDDPILVDRDKLERRMTQALIAHMKADGVEMHTDTRLPGFILQPDPVLPNHKVCRIACEVALLPALRWPRGR